MNSRDVIPAQPLRIYCDFDGTLTKFSGSTTWRVYQQHAREQPHLYPFGVHVIANADTRGHCYTIFLQNNKDYQILPEAQPFIKNMLANRSVEFVIVSRSYKQMIGAALELSGIDSSQVTILDVNHLGFEKSKFRSVSDYEESHPSKGPLLFIDDTEGDATAMKKAFIQDVRYDQAVSITEPAGKFNFSKVEKTVNQMLSAWRASPSRRQADADALSTDKEEASATSLDANPSVEEAVISAVPSERASARSSSYGYFYENGVQPEVAAVSTQPNALVSGECVERLAQQSAGEQHLELENASPTPRMGKN